MKTSGSSAAARTYLRRLNLGLWALPRRERLRILDEIRSHLDERMASGGPEAAVRSLGDAATLARSFREDYQAAQDREPPRPADCNDLLIKGMRSGEIPDPAGFLKLIDGLAMESKLAIDQRDAEWIAAAQAAIAKNKSTFTLLAMYQIKSPTGYVAKLKELGYAVEEPDLPPSTH